MLPSLALVLPLVAALGLPQAANAATSCSLAPDLTQLATFDYRPRVFILTDILNEPDDSMSLVRYLLYANEFDTRGLCAVTSTWLRNATHPEQMRDIINAYGKVVDNLNHHVHPKNSYLPAEHFLSLVTTGPPVFGKKALNMSLSEGAQRLINALRESEEPLYVSVWGGANVLAQALHHMQQTMSEADAAAQRAKLRVYTISDQDDTGPWIRAQFPDIHFTVSVHRWNDYALATWTGMNEGSGPGPDPTKVLNPWLDGNIRLGELGAVYPQVVFGMEGDTPSFLYLVQNGLGHREHIEWGGWGGRYGRVQANADFVSPGTDGNIFTDSSEIAVGADGVTLYTTNKASVWRWRDAMQDDFAARMQWTLTSNFAEAGHPPIVDVNGHKGPDPIIIPVGAPNTTYTLNASGTYDPDRPGTNARLGYVWFWYDAVTASTALTYPGDVQIKAQDAAAAQPASWTGTLVNNTAGFANFTRGVTVQVTPPPPVVNKQTGIGMPDIHIVLQVTNTAGPHPIRRYKRVIFTYS